VGSGSDLSYVSTTSGANAVGNGSFGLTYSGFSFEDQSFLFTGTTGVSMGVEGVEGIDGPFPSPGRCCCSAVAYLALLPVVAAAHSLHAGCLAPLPDVGCAKHSQSERREWTS
jgi:hypothetical protein